MNTSKTDVISQNKTYIDEVFDAPSFASRSASSLPSMPRCAATYLNSIDLHSDHDMAVMARWLRGQGAAMYTNRRSCLNATNSESMCSSKSRLRTGFLLAVCQPFFFQFGIHAVTDFIYGHKHTHARTQHEMERQHSPNTIHQPNTRCRYSRRSFAQPWP